MDIVEPPQVGIVQAHCTPPCSGDVWLKIAETGIASLPLPFRKPLLGERGPDENIKDLRSVLTVVRRKVMYDDLDGSRRTTGSGLP